MICKICNEDKVCEYSHIGKNGAKLYKDERGRLWKSKVCADCQAKKRREARNAKKGST